MTRFFKPITGLILIIALLACESADDKQSDLASNFWISGSIKDAGGAAIYIEAISQQGTIEVAKGLVEQDGSFDLEGNIPGMGIYQMRIGESKEKAIPLTLVPEDHVKINSTFESFNFRPNLSGVSWAKAVNTYLGLYQKFLDDQQQMQVNQAGQSEEDMQKIYLEIKKPLDDFALKTMKATPSNPFNIVLLSSAMPIMGFEVWDPSSLNIMKAVSVAFSKKFPDSPLSKTIEEQTFQVEQAYNEYLATKNGGVKTAPEISLQDPNGKVLKLSSLRGKVVLVDFWASWCGPCRRENPNVVRIYNTYKDKGFTVFSVSLDEDPLAWKAAIKADGLIWPYHVSDLLSWSTPLTVKYGFDSIPFTVLVDKNGQIVATGLRGQELEQKIKTLL